MCVAGKLVTTAILHVQVSTSTWCWHVPRLAHGNLLSAHFSNIIFTTSVRIGNVTLR